MAKKITNKDRKFQKHKDKRLYRNLRDAYFETRKEEFLRTGLYNPMSFRNFLVMYMNYSVEEANSITAIYNKLDKKYKYSVNIEDEDPNVWCVQAILLRGHVAPKQKDGKADDFYTLITNNEQLIQKQFHQAKIIILVSTKITNSNFFPMLVICPRIT